MIAQYIIHFQLGLPRSLNKMTDDRDVINSRSRSPPSVDSMPSCLSGPLCWQRDTIVDGRSADRWGREELAALWCHILAEACCCNWLATPHLPPLPMWC